MSVLKHQLLFLLLVSISCLLLANSVIIYNTEISGLFSLHVNIPFTISIVSVGLIFFIFNQFYLRLSIAFNLFYSFPSIGISYFIAQVLFDLFHAWGLSYSGNPLGYYFQYLWGVIPLMTIFLIFISKLIGERRSDLN